MGVAASSSLPQRFCMAAAQLPCFGRTLRMKAFRLLAFAGLVFAVRNISHQISCFISTGRPSNLNLSKPDSATLRRAEDAGKEDGGFLKFLKVEKEIELSPEEYEFALQEEIEVQRKKYYIGGVVSEKNKIVPWKEVDETVIEKEAKRVLRKNGIKDPDADPAVEAEEEESAVELTLFGEQDVRLDWSSGAPGVKVGYIIEKKKAQGTNFQEIASYEDFNYLLMQEYQADFTHTDELVSPGAWTYRILCRYRTGEIKVVDEQDITVPEQSGINNTVALYILIGVLLGSFGFAYFADPPMSK